MGELHECVVLDDLSNQVKGNPTNTGNKADNGREDKPLPRGFEVELPDRRGEVVQGSEGWSGERRLQQLNCGCFRKAYHTAKRLFGACRTSQLLRKAPLWALSYRAGPTYWPLGLSSGS